ncbi:MAG: adenosylcobinamide-GDP ribazoletransferase [Planctomycetes bacterium]|nr:adenosylcobinamide-GDP ribazoletransferase [Planctomycetota bacterium]
MNNFIWALKFLTTLPVRSKTGEFSEKHNYIVFWFPIVGIVIGIILSIFYVIFQYVFPCFISNALVLILYIIITGALHLDGFADSCDGIFGGWNRERRLEIMKDSHIGSYGTIGLVCITGVRYVCLLCIGDYSSGKETITVLSPTFHMITSKYISSGLLLKIIVLCLMPVAGRWAQVFASGISHYARETSGTGAFIVNSTTMRHVIIASIIPLLLMLFFFRIKGLAACTIIVILTLCAIWYIKKKIGGMTGDTLGAINEMAEIIFLLSIFVVF